MSFKPSISSAIAAIAILFSSACFAQASITEGGVSGQWYNPARDGEGLFVEVVESGGGQQISVAWFTYDMEGFQMWLVGNVVLGGDPEAVTIPVVVTNGPKFGPDYDSAALNRQTWGTLTITFPNCNSAILAWDSSAGFGSGAIELSRLTTLTQVRCTNPSLPPSGTGITPGTWRGNGVCFHVSADGRTLTSAGSPCDDGHALDVEVNGTTAGGGQCEAEVECNGVVAIVDNGFSCSGDGGRTIATFNNPTSMSGVVQESDDGQLCTANYSAQPNNP